MDPLKISVGGGGLPARPEPLAVREEPRVRPAHEGEESFDSEKENDAAPERREPGVEGSHVVSYAIDEKTQEVITRIVDRETGEVVREVPQKELRATMQALKDLIDRTA